MTPKQQRKRPPAKKPAGTSKTNKSGASKAAAARAAQTRFPVFWTAIGVVVAIAAGAAIVASMSGDSSSSSGSGGKGNGHEFGTVVVTGTALARHSDSGHDPAVGETIPTVKGENFAGTPVTIAPNGKAQMIVFLAHWCPHCNAEAPKLAAYLADNGGTPPGVDLTIVPTGSNAQAPNWPPSQWVKDEKLGDVTTLVDDQAGTAATAFGLDAYPFIVGVDKNGRVVDRRTGEQADGFFAAAFAALADGSNYPG